MPLQDWAVCEDCREIEVHTKITAFVREKLSSKTERCAKIEGKLRCTPKSQRLSRLNFPLKLGSAAFWSAKFADPIVVVVERMEGKSRCNKQLLHPPAASVIQGARRASGHQAKARKASSKKAKRLARTHKAPTICGLRRQGEVSPQSQTLQRASPVPSNPCTCSARAEGSTRCA